MKRKLIFLPTGAVVILILSAFTFSASAPMPEEAFLPQKKEVTRHVTIKVDENGKTAKLDTVFTGMTDEDIQQEIDKFMQEHDVSQKEFKVQMKFFADLHIHSHYSIATSRQLVIPQLDLWGRKKGNSSPGMLIRHRWPDR